MPRMAADTSVRPVRAAAFAKVNLTLRVLTKLWRLDLRAARLQRIASDLGADVPFFLLGGTALGVERGNVLIPQPDGDPAWVVVVLPAFGVSTVEAYRWWDADNRSRGV